MKIEIFVVWSLYAKQFWPHPLAGYCTCFTKHVFTLQLIKSVRNFLAPPEVGETIMAQVPPFHDEEQQAKIWTKM